MKQYKNVNELWGAIVNGDMDPSVSDFFVTGASYIYQTTQFPNSINLSLIHISEPTRP